MPLRRFEFRGQLGPDRVMRRPSIYGEVTCRDVPVYGDALGLTGLCNRDGTLITTGTYLTRAYDRRGAANRRPAGLSVSGIDLTRPTAGADGVARARFALAQGRRFRAAAHLTTVLLTDARTGAPVSVDYRKETTSVASANGDLAEARVRIPAGTRVPARVRAYVIADAFPLASRELR